MDGFASITFFLESLIPQLRLSTTRQSEELTNINIIRIISEWPISVSIDIVVRVNYENMSFKSSSPIRLTLLEGYH